MTFNKLTFEATLKRLKAKIIANKNHDKELSTRLKKEKEEENTIAIKGCLRRANLPTTSGIDKLEKIKPETPQQKKVIRELSMWNPSRNFRLPYIYGPPGTGKSFIASCFLYTLINEGIEGIRFISLSEFLINYRNFSAGSSIGSITSPYVLVIDDFCAHNSSKVILEVLHAAIDSRLRNRKPTLITSNVAPNHISAFLYRMGKNADVSNIMCKTIEDRIFDLCNLVPLKSTSIREKMALARLERARGY